MNKLLKFSRSGCTPCVIMEKKLNSEDVKFESYDVEHDIEVTSKYGVGGVPTLLLVNEDGDVLDMLVGFDADKIDEMVEAL